MSAYSLRRCSLWAATEETHIAYLRIRSEDVRDAAARGLIAGCTQRGLRILTGLINEGQRDETFVAAAKALKDRLGVTPGTLALVDPADGGQVSLADGQSDAYSV